jgi:NAD(P)-dependent dehydrogenase (short-subunit alcohol dehydrogenase family)
MPLGLSRMYRASIATRKEFVERDGGGRYIKGCGEGYFELVVMKAFNRIIGVYKLGTNESSMKKIFLTGASSGIGRAIAEMLVGQGHEVWGTSRNLERIPKMTRLYPVHLDLSDPRLVEETFNAAFAEAGYLDVLINNAGAGHFGPAELLPLETITSQFQVLVFGQIQLMQLALHHMRPRGEGLIVNVSSLASRLPVPFMAAYNSAKAALASFIMSIQLELAHPRVRIVDLQPADIRTEFNQSVIKDTKTDPLYAAAVSKTWGIVQRNMNNAPSPDLVARRVLGLVNAAHPAPRITVGDVFQSKIAPLIFRFLPQQVRLWGLRRYYDL